MKSKTTTLWFVLAVALATAIWVLNTYFQPVVTGPVPMLAGFRVDRVTAVEIIPAGARISVTRTNKTWLLNKPLVYPASTVAIDGLLDVLQKMTPVTTLSAAEMSGRKNAEAEFGFENPQFKLDISAGEQTAWHLVVGNKTAPGDGVYVRVTGTPGAFVTDTTWLQYIPHDATDWRDTTLADLPAALNWLIITNGTQAIELRRDITNRLWRMIRPLQARADNLRIVTALNQLRTAQVTRFISDDPKADLTPYGLEPAALDVWLGSGTNLLTAIHAGKNVTGMADEIFARREGWNAIVTTAKEPLAPWRGTVNDFRDPFLLEQTAPIAEIEVHGEFGYTLQDHGSAGWSLAGEKFPVDASQVTALIRRLKGLRIADFVQDVVVTSSGLQTYGLANPARQITLRAAVGDTNSVNAQLLFGAETNGQVYVKRAGEGYVYALAQGDYSQLPFNLSGDYFRTTQVWNFSETNVAQITLRTNGRMRQMVRGGTNDWSLAAGSQGIIDNPPAVEETVHRLGDLTVLAWIGRKFTDADIGLTTNSPAITVELKSGEKYTVQFGAEQPLPSLRTQTALAVVTLQGERWAFVFPPVLYQLVREFLTIPVTSP